MVEEIVRCGKHIMKSDILLPVELAESGKLSLSQIGALFVLMAMPHLDTTNPWNHDSEFKDIVSDLVNKRIIIPSMDGDELNIEIDITDI